MKKNGIYLTGTFVCFLLAGFFFLSHNHPSASPSHENNKIANGKPNGNDRKAKARSSKAILHLLKPETNVEAPIEDAALIALGKDERARRDSQDSRLMDSAQQPFAPLFAKLEALTKEMEGEDTSATRLLSISIKVERTMSALDSAIEEVTGDSSNADTLDKVDEQFEKFQKAGIAERDILLPELQANLSKILGQIATKASNKAGL